MALISVRFWGVRGSIPAPGFATVGFGGNTSCVEVRAGDDVVILDMGSGLRMLGESMGRAPAKASLFLSHYHWDHIQGLPFFGPAYNPASALDIYGPVREGRDVRSILSGQMVAPYFPVTLEAFRARIGFHTVADGQTIRIGATRVTASELNHPNGVLAYRVEHEGKAVVYATDTEHGTAADRALVALAHDAEALIYDSMYTDDEYTGSKTGWGHSTWSAGLQIVQKAGAKRLVLFHHEPTRTDRDLEALWNTVKGQGGTALMAREGETLEF
ncbi:MAG: MBL fold metallo-hydrolase [Deltaproteobacteria bacterium]|nr:MBL fold metallo-hydrolase [Deltaproteobacteria bacterium]